MNVISEERLRYVGNGSDKTYEIRLFEDPPGSGQFGVEGYNGRTGRPLKHQPKLRGASRYSAQNTYEDILNEKLRKGYKPSTGMRYSVMEAMEVRQTDRLSQLLNEIDEARVEALLKDDEFVLEKKEDGDRHTFSRISGKPESTNRKAQTIPVPEILSSALDVFPEGGPCDTDFIVDGEFADGMLHVFDVLMYDGQDVRSLPFSRRRGILESLTYCDGKIRLVEQAKGEEAKRALKARLESERAEGYVFKRLSAPHIAGTSHEDQFKFKMTKTATVRIGGRRNPAVKSVTMYVREGEGERLVGSVTIGGKQDEPAPGTLAEIRYLYCNRGGSLFQPHYLGVRSDKDEADTYESLSFKNEGATEEDSEDGSGAV